MATLAQIYTGLTGHSASGKEGGREVTPWAVAGQQVEPGGALVVWGKGVEQRRQEVAEGLRRGAVVMIAEGKAAAFDGFQAQVVDVALPSTEPLQPPVLFVVEDAFAAIQKLISGRCSHATPSLQIVAILGGGGRATVKEMVSVVLSQRFRTWQVPETSSDLAALLALLDMPLDTERAVLGLSGEGEEGVNLVQPDVAVVTPVATHPSEGVRRWLATLSSTGTAILQEEEETGAEGNRFLYGLEPGCALWADQIEGHGLDGMAFRFHHEGESIFARVPILGRYSVHAVLAAASVGITQGQSWAEIMAGLKDLTEMEMLRLMVVEGVNGVTLLDDSYEASPESVLAALNLLNNLDGRKVAVLGDMDDLEEQGEKGHRLVAARAAGVARLFVAVGQMAALMVEEARASGLSAARSFAASTLEEAALWLRGQFKAGDIVLFKGARELRLDALVTQLSAEGETV